MPFPPEEVATWRRLRNRIRQAARRRPCASRQGSYGSRVPQGPDTARARSAGRVNSPMAGFTTFVGRLWLALRLWNEHRLRHPWLSAGRRTRVLRRNLSGTGVLRGSYHPRRSEGLGPRIAGPLNWKSCVSPLRHRPWVTRSLDWQSFSHYLGQGRSLCLRRWRRQRCLRRRRP